MSVSIVQGVVGNQVLGSGCLVDNNVLANRMYYHRDGSIELVGKPLAVVFGERVIRPLVDSAYTLTAHTFRVLKRGFLFLDSALSSALNIIPVAQASLLVKAENSDLNDSTNYESTNYACPSLQALANVHARSRKNPLGIERLQAQVILSEPKETFQSIDEAKRYLEARMGPISKPQTSCLAENAIRIIKETKTPNLVQKIELERAFEELQTLTDQDALKYCEQRIMELLSELTTTLPQYSLSALDSLPKVISSLLNQTGMDYTFADLDVFQANINQLAREMAVKYQKTNQDKRLHQWIDIMLESAGKNGDNAEALLSTFKTAIKILQSSTEIKVQSEQKKKLRKMAKLFQLGALSPQQLAVVADVLKITGSKIWLLDIVHSYLECLPDDIAKVEESLNDIGAALYKNKSVKMIGIASLLVPLVLWPDRVKKAVIILAILFAIRHVFFKD